jgi:hypothetical protein
MPSAIVEQARELLAASGGLATSAELARRWGLCRQRVSQLAAEPSFPEPVVTVGRHSLWLVTEADTWQHDREMHRLLARYPVLEEDG